MKVVCSCGKTLQLPDALANKRVKCPYCRASVDVKPPAPAFVVPEDPTQELLQAIGKHPAAGSQGGDLDEHLASLTAAIDGASDPSKPVRPAAVGSAPVGGAGRPLPVAAPIPKSQSKQKLYIIAAGIGGVLLLLVVGVIMVASNLGDKKPTQPVEQVAPKFIETKPVQQAKTDNMVRSAGGNGELFPNVPDGTTSRDKKSKKAVTE